LIGTTKWVSELNPPPSANRDHLQGRLDAPAQLAEYGDFECPFCGAAYPIVKAVQRAMADQLLFAFRHFPMSTIHPQAELAAEAAEAAGAQGKFWEMHDVLFENQPRLRAEDLSTYAEALDLDMDRFDADLASHRYQPRIREDFLSGVWSGVNGTPTFFINGLRHDGSYDYDSLMAALIRAAEAA
jgi:protein-disulfide isomerase